VRACCACGKPDAVRVMDGKADHSVTVELKFITAQNPEQAKRQITPYLAARGWRYRFHLGRHAMERDICRECLNAHSEMSKEFSRKRTNELKSSMNSESYYLAICGD